MGWDLYVSIYRPVDFPHYYGNILGDILDS